MHYNNRSHPMSKRSIQLKAYRRPDGREVHYAAARLRRDPGASTAAVLDADAPDDASKVGACWVFFYPMGPSRRLLDAVISRYAPKFECDKDVLFLCVNRPGKGGTSSSSSSSVDEQDETAASERQHIRTACDDVVTILDHYGVVRTSLLYMCAGSTFAYSFASQHPERTTGYVVGIASWVLRSDPSSSASCHNCNTVEGVEYDLPTPQRMNSWTHRLAMQGVFGPKWMVSWLAGGITGSMSVMLGSLPPGIVGKELKKSLSEDEKAMFDEAYPDDAVFVERMKWIHDDGCDEEVSTFVNGGAAVDVGGGIDSDGNAKDCAVCLSTQQEVGMVYKTAIPPQKQVLLWHGVNDKMVSVLGASYLEAVVPNATLTIVSGGTHQGVMFFIPEAAMEALNRISRDITV